MKKIAKENNFATILAHAPYTLNCASADESIRVFAKNTRIWRKFPIFVGK